MKECDRIAAPTRELRKLGVTVEEGPDYMVIEPLVGGSRRATAQVVEIETYHDHRIAMSFGVLGSRLPGLRILDPGCVAKTYPNYWKDWQRARSAARLNSGLHCFGRRRFGGVKVGREPLGS